jgi:uncharacterized cupredoxin-like copper-binding protein
MKFTPHIIIACLFLVGCNRRDAQLQKGISDGPVILYQLDRNHGQYVLSTSFESVETGKISIVVVSDTFVVEPRGAVCNAVMSNAYVLQTTVGPSPSNKVEQIKMLLDLYKMPFPKQTKLVFNGSVVELAKMNEAAVEANATVYEGAEALRQMKRMGEKPPDDMDWQKATNK